MPDFPIIDSHVHFIDPRHFRYAWLAHRPSIDRPFLPSDFARTISDVAVEGVVFVEAWPDPGQHVAEAQFAQALADAGAPILGIVANVPVMSGSTVELAPLRRLPLLRGARHLIEGALDPTFCLEPSFLAGVRKVAASGLPFDLCLKH